jgi:hypothetical protein
VERVLDIMRAANLKAKISKCHFGMSTITYLGFRVSEQGIQPEPEKTRAIRDAAAPTTVKALRGFLGMMGFYRMFIRDFATKAAPLNKLLAGDAKWEWAAEQQAAFERLKQELVEAPILAYPDPARPYEVHIDTSDAGIGGILVQRDDANKPHIVTCMSRALRDYEMGYGAPEKECLAIVWAT